MPDVPDSPSVLFDRFEGFPYVTIMDTGLLQRADFQDDEHAWLLEQAASAAAGRHADLDLAHLAEFLISMAKSEEREVKSRLVVLLHHLLKVRYQPHMETGSWGLTIDVQRDELDALFEDSASLRAKADLMLAGAYRAARRRAARETKLLISTFPEASPWSVAEALRHDAQD